MAKRYFVSEGTDTIAEFNTAKELNAWYDKQNCEGQYFCRLYDRAKGISILGRDYMWLKPEDRWADDCSEAGSKGNGEFQRKHYYRYMPRNFGNEYDLISVSNKTEEAELQKEFENCYQHGGRIERITVKEIQQLAHEERERRKYDANFSGYCDLTPCPWSVYNSGVPNAIDKYREKERQYKYDYYFG